MNQEHITFRQVEEYASKRLPAGQIRALHQHAETCSSCRGMLVDSMGESGAEHVTEKQAVEFVAGLLPADEKSRVARHLENCGSCAAAVADLEEFRESEEFRQTPPAPVQARWRTTRWALPIAAALFLVAGASVWWMLRANHAQPQMMARLQDASGVLGLNQNGTLVTGAPLPSGAEELLTSALRTGQLPLGPAALVTEDPGTLRSVTSGGSQPELKILSPNGVRVVSDHPEFRWLPLRGASSYQITVTDEDLNEIARSGLVQHTIWVPETPLPRLKPLLWQVAAIRQGLRITAPAPPEPAPHFEIVSADAARQIAEARDAAHPSHLLLAILYSQAGLRQEAASELDAISTLNRGSALAGSLRDSLQATPQK